MEGEIIRLAKDKKHTVHFWRINDLTPVPSMWFALSCDAPVSSGSDAAKIQVKQGNVETLYRGLTAGETQFFSLGPELFSGPPLSLVIKGSSAGFQGRLILR